MANEFNPQLSKARMQKAGVVDETAGMKYEIADNLLKTGVQEYGEYQLRNVNQTINEELNKDYAVSSDEQTVLKGFNDEIGMELLREEQGITNQQQRTFNINKAAAAAKARAPWMSDQIDKTVAAKIGMTGASSRAASSASTLKTETEKARANLAKQREEISLQFFGVSSTKLNEEQYKMVRDFERAKAANQIEEVALKTEQLAHDRSKLDKEKLAELDNDNKIRINKIGDTSFASLNNIITTSLNKEGLTMEDYNGAVNSIKVNGNNLINQVTKAYVEAGMPVDQTYIDNIQKRIDNSVKNIEMYKTTTLEEKRKLKMDEFAKMVDIDNKMSQSASQNLTSLNTKLNLLDKTQIKNMLSSNNVFALESANKFFGPEFAAKYTQDGKFNGAAAVEDLTSIQSFSGFNLEKQYGEIKSLDLAIQAAKTTNFGLANNATNLIIEGENKDPQTDAIRYLTIKQCERADEAIEYSGKANSGMPYVESNLKMLASNNYNFGNPNTEISAYRIEQADLLLQTSAYYISRVISENPDNVEIVNGNIVSADEAVTRSLNQMYIIAEKSKNIPNAREKILNKITEIKQNAIENTIIKPMRDEISKEINSNPIYSGLSPAEKEELMTEVIKQERTIQQAEGLKLRQAGETERIANEIGNVAKYNQSGIRTAFASIGTILSPSAETSLLDRTKAYAYLGLTADSIKDKVVGTVDIIGRKLFGDSLVEKTEQAYDKKLGLPQFQARTIKQMQGKTMDIDKANNIYERMQPLHQELEYRQMLGETLTPQETELFRYYNKFMDVYDKNYKSVSLANMPDTSDKTAAEITERIMAGETQSEAEQNVEQEQVTNRISEIEADKEEAQLINTYNLTFENEIGRGRTDSRELHLPSETSGVTIGPGYDLGERTADEIISDLTSVGISQEDAERISQGAGLTGADAESFIDSNDDIEITDEQEQALFNKVVPMYIDRASNEYESFDIEGKPSFEELPETVKQLLVDYSYNVGVSKFPKFFEAVVKGDKEEALKQYKRYTGDKPLGRRNKDTLKVLNSYDFVDLTN